MREGIVFEVSNENTVVMTSEGEFLSIPSNPNWKLGDTVRFSDIERKTQQNKDMNSSRKKPIWLHKGIWIAMVASLLIFMLPLSLVTEASSYVTLDINPSLELKVKKDKVMDVQPLNEDAETLLTKLDSSSLDGDIYEVTSIIIEEAKKQGYLKEEEQNFIMIGISGSDKFASKYEDHIQKELVVENIQAEVLFISGSESTKELADKKGISVGRYMLQEKEKKQGIIIDDEEIAKESIKSIMNKIKEEEKNHKANDKDKSSDTNDKDKKDKDSVKANNKAEKDSNGSDKNGNSDKTKETNSKDKDSNKNDDKNENKDDDLKDKDNREKGKEETHQDGNNSSSTPLNN